MKGDCPVKQDDYQLPEQEGAVQGRLLARPRRAKGPDLVGMQPLGLDGDRDGLLYVPPGYQSNHPAPLVLTLHGAGGNARHALAPLLPLADANGLILLATDSRLDTWDVLYGGYGPDVAFIDRALTLTFDRYKVDPARIAAEGFSDGASYALSIGLTNGDLFTHVMAFSPGFMAPAGLHGSPRIFVSHGTRDAVLPIKVCSRRIVPRLQRAGYHPQYREFEGGHEVPPEIAREAVRWFLRSEG